TLALIQGVVNTFVIFAARVVGYIVDSALRGNREGGGIGIGYFVTTIIAEIVFGILASMIVMWFSRYREFRADHGGAQLAGRSKMISALERLQQSQEGALPDQLAAFGIKGSIGRGFKRLFMSHPPLSERVAALQRMV
ncbi:MAG TPA: M48 family metalloprotease, partial [Gammaproteobacteria bacterium]